MNPFVQTLQQANAPGQYQAGQIVRFTVRDAARVKLLPSDNDELAA